MHRIRLLVLEIYKIIHSIGPKYLDDMFTTKNITYSMRDNMKLIVPKPKTVKYGKRSLQYEGSRLWNLLTNDTQLAVHFLSALSCSGKSQIVNVLTVICVN